MPSRIRPESGVARGPMSIGVAAVCAVCAIRVVIELHPAWEDLWSRDGSSRRSCSLLRPMERPRVQQYHYRVMSAWFR